MDVFRVFDSLNYVPNMVLGMEAAGQAGNLEMILPAFTLALNAQSYLSARFYKWLIINSEVS